MIEGFGLDRLGDEVVHSGLFASQPVFVEGVGGHRQNRRLAATRQGANGAGGFEAVHVRHLHVHQNQRVSRRARLIQRLPAVGRHIDRQTGTVQQFQRDFTVDRLVFGKQNAGAGVRPAQLRFNALGAGSLHFGGHGTVAALQAGGKPEAAAHPRRTLRTDLAAHQFRQSPGDGQPEAGAAVAARDRGVGLFEGLEQALQLFRLDPDTGVGHREAHQQFAVIIFQQLGAQRNGTPPGELDRVAGIVEQRLAQARHIAAQPQRHPVAVELDRQPLAPRRIADDRCDVVEYRGKMEIGAFQLHAAGFDLGQIEDVVDDAEQVPPGATDFFQPFGLFRCHAVALDEVRQADDGVHRCADLVAHVGQEAALCLVRGVGLHTRHAQFGGALGDQFFQVVSIAIEFLTDTLLLGDVFLDRHIVADASVGLADRRDDGELGVSAAILLAIVELAFPRLALGQRRPQGHIGLARRLARVQEARVAAERFFAAVTSRPNEGVIDVLDARLGIGDDDAFRALLDRLRQLAQFIPGLLAVGDVPAYGGPSDDLAAGVADAEEVVEHPDRRAGLKMAQADLHVAMTLPQHAREEFLRDEPLILREKIILYTDLAGGGQVGKPDHAQARRVHIVWLQVEVAHADEFAAAFGQHGKLLPPRLRKPAPGDIASQ